MVWRWSGVDVRNPLPSPLPEGRGSRSVLFASSESSCDCFLLLRYSRMTPNPKSAQDSSLSLQGEGWGEGRSPLRTPQPPANTFREQARSYTCRKNTDVGWVERSDTHRHDRLGFAKAQPILRKARTQTPFPAPGKRRFHLPAIPCIENF